MSSNSKLRDDMRFQQRWDFRRGDSDFDTSSSDSRNSLGIEPDHKRHKAVSSSVHADNNDDEIVKFQLKSSSIDPATSGKTENGKAEKATRGRGKRENLNENKTESRKVVKVEKTANSNAALNDLKNHMNSLLEELKVSRKNLLSWMREEMKKLAAQEKGSVSERNKDGLKGDEAELEHQNNLFGKNIQTPYHNNFEKHVQVNKTIKFDENVQMKNVINLEDDIETQPQPKTQEKDQMQDSSTTAKNGNGLVYKRSNKRKALADSKNCNPELEQQNDYSSAIVLAEDGEKKTALGGKSKVQPQKSIVLGIRAPNSKVGLSASKGKKAADSIRVPDFQLGYSQATAAEKKQLERSGLSFKPNESFGQVASSMYLTLPSALAKTNVSHIQPRLAQNQSGKDSQLASLMLGSSSHLGNFQAEERGRNYAQMSFRDICFLNNGFTAPLYPGFNIPIHLSLENLPRENNRPDLTMNGGGSGSGRNYPFAEMPSNYTTDGRLVSYEDSNQFPSAEIACLQFQNL